MGTVYAVASAKGGVGKTTTTAALATILADSGADVVAIDADLGMANLANAVGVTPGETTLHDALAGEAAPAAAVHDGPAGLRVVPGAADLDAYAAADPSELRRVIESFDEADYVVVDGGAGLSHDSTLPLAIADETLLVSTPGRSALGDTEKTRQLTERLGGTVAGAAITRVESGSDAAADETVSAILDAPVIGRIPEDEAVARAVAANRSLSVDAPNSPAVRAYRDLARSLTGVAVDGTSESPAGDEAETPDDGAGEHGSSEDGDNDIIVADPDPTGVADPGDGDDIIVADESSPEPLTAEESTTVESAAADDDTAGETTNADRGDDPDAAPDADAVAAESGDDADEGDDDAALAGSVPFHDDDGTMTTVLSEASDDESSADDRAESSADEGGDTTGSDASKGDVAISDASDDTNAAGSGDSEDDATDLENGDDGGGFFSRLLGR